MTHKQLADFLDHLGAAFARGEYPDDAVHTRRLQLWEAATALRVAARQPALGALQNIAWTRDRVELYPDKAVLEIERLQKLLEQLEVAREAIEAHGNTELTIAWYRKWKPDYFSRSGIPTTAQYSLSCFLMQHAADLLRAEAAPCNCGAAGFDAHLACCVSQIRGGKA